jgi:hypothetical protein
MDWMVVVTTEKTMSLNRTQLAARMEELLGEGEDEDDLDKEFVYLIPGVDFIAVDRKPSRTAQGSSRT